MSFIEKFKVTLRKDHQQHFLIGLAVGLIGLTVEVYHFLFCCIGLH